MAEHDVRVVYTKYDGSLHWHYTMQHLGADSHGVWLGAPAGTVSRRGSEPPIVIEHPFVMLIPAGDQWWTATFYAEPRPVEIYCDVGTPARWPHDGEVTMADLDLDVLRLRPRDQVLLDDEDEFAEHQVRYGYPAEVIRAAEQAATWLQAAITAGAEPFGTDYLAWLAQVTPPDVAQTAAVTGT